MNFSWNYGHQSYAIVCSIPITQEDPFAGLEEDEDELEENETVLDEYWLS